MLESPQQNALYVGAWEEPVNSWSFLQLLIQGLLKEKEISTFQSSSDLVCFQTQNSGRINIFYFRSLNTKFSERKIAI